MTIASRLKIGLPVFFAAVLAVLGPAWLGYAIARGDAGIEAAAPEVADTAPTPSPSSSPSASVPNPATSPAQTWDDLKAAKKTGWPLAVFFALVALTKALAYGRDKLKSWPVVGKAAAWLAKGKAAMVVAGVSALAVAGYDVLAGGGSWVSALIAGSVAIAGALHSTTQPKPPADV